MPYNSVNSSSHLDWDYAAFGSTIKEISYAHSFDGDTARYRYGFSKMERDDEATVNGGSYDFENRMYDSRLGKWLSVDPLNYKYPSNSPYVYCASNPLIFIDIDGRDFIIFFEKNVKTTTVTHTDNGPVTTTKTTTEISYTIIKHPGEDKFFYQTTNINETESINDPNCISCLASNAFKKVTLPGTTVTSKEFYPILNGMINDRYSQGITKTEFWPFSFWDGDIITLAKLAPKELRDYLTAKDPRYRVLASYSFGYKVTMIGLQVYTLAVLTADIAPGIQSVIKSFSRSTLLNILKSNGVKHTPSDVIHIGLNAKQEIIFLEKGNSGAGLAHILEKHATQFMDKGVKYDDIGELVFKAATEGKYIRMEGTRPVYEIMYNGKPLHVAVTISENGFIVGANPVTIK